MKTALLLLLASVVVAPGAMTVTIDYNSANPGDPLDGYDGWVQSETNTSNASPLAWVGILTGERSAAIGGWYDVPAGDPLSVKHPVGVAIDNSSVAMNFGITPSTASWPGQDDFAITFVDNARGDVFSLNFTGVGPQWNVSWSSSFAAAVSAPFAGVLPGGHYTYVFNTVGNDVHYSIYGPLNSVAGSATIPGLSAANIDSLRLDWKNSGGGQWGDNFLSIGSVGVCADNLATPEPDSTWIVVGLFVSALMLRTRRGVAK